MNQHKRMPVCRSTGKGSGLRVAPARIGARYAPLVLAIAWAACASAEVADEHAGEDLHAPLETSAALTWAQLIDTTLAHYPQFVELAAREREAGALEQRGRGWLSAQPSVSMRYQTDRPWDNANLREYELGLNLPLWRIGQRRAASSLGSAATLASGAAAAALRHEVIGWLRNTLWDIERAANELAVAQEGARVAGELVAAIERQYEVGELPLSETLLVRSTAMEREAAVIEAEAALVDAQRAYQSLTGLTVKPAFFAETLTDRVEFDGSHPELAFSDAELERARASLELAQRTAKGTPTLTIGPRRERSAFSTYDADTLGVTVTMPFGGRAYADATTTSSVRAVAEAESSRLQLLRELDLELHEARHGLVVIEEALALAEQRSALASRTFDMSRQAFLQGEMSLLELLRSEETALTTQRAVAGLEVERQRAIAQINQAVGVWP